MKILIIYATNSGSTFLVAEIIKELLDSNNHSIILKRAQDAVPEDLDLFDLILMGSPSWDYNGQYGMPIEAMVNFMKRCAGYSFTGKKFALFGCGDADYTYYCGAINHMKEFVKEVGGDQILTSLRINTFYFNQEKGIKMTENWIEQLEKKIG